MELKINMKLSTIIKDVNAFKHEIFLEDQIGIEIQTFPQDIMDENNDQLIKLWKEKLVGFDGTISLHGSSFDLNPGNTDKKILEVTKYRYLQSVNLGKQLGAKYLIFHSQINPFPKVKHIRNKKLNNQIDFWNNLLSNHIPKDITVLLENEYDESPDELLRLIEGIDHDNIGVCLDVGHVLAYSSSDLQNWFSQLKDYIKYIHLHWNDGQSDAHEAPREENLILLSHLLEAYRLDSIITLEYMNIDILSEIKRIRQVIERN